MYKPKKYICKTKNTEMERLLIIKNQKSIYIKLKTLRWSLSLRCRNQKSIYIKLKTLRCEDFSVCVLR